jgi:MFS family permease
MFAAIMSLAAGIGPVVGGELVTWFGWPSIFLVNLPILAVSAALAVSMRLFRTPHGETARPRFDWAGAVLLAAVLSTFVVGLEAAGTPSTLLLTLCVVLVVPFVWWERRTGDPIVAFALFRSSAFTAGTALIAMQNLAMYTLVFELPQVLRALLAVDAATTGRLLVTMMAAMVATSIVAGRLVDRLGARIIAVTGSLACLAGVGVLAVSGLTTATQVLVPLVLLGLGIGLATPAAQSASLGAVDRRDSGMAAGVNSTMRYLGGIIGVAILGHSLNLTADRAHILAEHRGMLVVFGAALAIGLACAIILPGRSIQPVATPASAGGRQTAG